jgi:hypothetical protein
MTTLDPTNKAIIDLDAPASPAILAGILDIPVSMVHQGRQDGKLPTKTSASYRESIRQYIYHYKKKVSSRSTSMGEAKLAQDIRNGIAKEQQQWLEIKQTKQELLDIEVMKELFEPVFQIIRSSLVNLARKNPETVADIDNMLASLSELGHKIADKANTDANNYVQEMLERELILQQAEEEVEEEFKLGTDDEF